MSIDPPPAMVLAAGKGQRLGKLGEQKPKPLVEVNGQPLIERLLLNLRAAGIRRCVINLHHLGEQIRAKIGTGSHWGLQISYSQENNLLDIAGGIRNALPLLGDTPFIVANADICCDFDFKILVALAANFHHRLGHLILGTNPSFRPNGDFQLHNGLIRPLGDNVGLTYLGIAMYAPEFFSEVPAGTNYPMRPLWNKAMKSGQLSGQYYHDKWLDVGTVERADTAQQLFATDSDKQQQ